ncbi:MAG: exodeoxyribonuclease III [Alphaproteobacteria bacterium]
MSEIKIASWNINSVRLRIGLVEKFLKAAKPDALALQETKTPNDLFPAKAFHKLGYKHIAMHGQKGHHGVAIVSRVPFEEETRAVFADKDDCRHICVRLLPEAAEPIEIHNFYVPSGGDLPDPEANAKFAHKLKFLKGMRDFSKRLANGKGEGRRLIMGDLNIAPLEHDVWSHKQMLDVVSHTPVEIEHLSTVAAAHDWKDLARLQTPEPEKLYTWWSYRARDWQASDRGRRLDHIWASPALAPRFKAIEILRPARGWKRPSDHVPVVATFDA